MPSLKTLWFVAALAIFCMGRGAFAAQGSGADTDASGSYSSVAAQTSSAPAAQAASPTAEPVSRLVNDLVARAAPAFASGTAVDLEAYTVLGNKDKGSETSMHMDVPAKDIPASVQVVNSEDMEQHAASQWVEALNYSSGIMAMETYGGFDSATVRGLPEPNLVVLNDGVRDDTYNLAYSSPQGNLAGVDSLQILKGPASLLYGTGALSGVINIVHKQPSDTPTFGVDLGYGSANTQQVAVGASGPLEGTPFLYRLDVASYSTDGFRQDPHNSVSGSLGLESRPWNGFTASYRGEIDHTHVNDPDPGIPVDATNQIPNEFPLGLNYGNPNDFIDYWDNRNVLTLRQDLGDHFKLSNLTSYQTKDYEYLESEGLTLEGDQQTINREYLFFYKHYQAWESQTEASWDFDGPIPQQGLVGYAFNYLQNGIEEDSNLDYNATNDDVNLYAGGLGSAPTLTVNPDTEEWQHEYSNGVYAQDFLTLQPWAKLLLAGRFDAYTRNQNVDTLQSGGPESGEAYDTYNAGGVTSTANSAPTWRAGLVLSPLDWLNVYGTYTTAFIPTFVANSANGNTWKPETGQMFESGLKWGTADGRYSGTAAWFDAQEDNIIFQTGIDPGVGTLYSQDDSRSSQGLDLQMDSRVFSTLRIKAGYTYVDARMNAFMNGGWINGRPYAVPMNSANLWLLEDLGRGFTIGLGGRYFGVSYADDVTDQVALPAYVVADAGLYYKPSKFWGVDLVVNNLFNLQRYFISSIEGNQFNLYPGEPLNLNLSTQFTF